MINIIAPHARPEFSCNLLANFRRQRYVKKRLIVVQNGPVVNFAGDNDIVVLTCKEQHQALAMNMGLNWLRSNGGGSWARFDDDDYYGPDYLLAVQDSFRCSDHDGVVVSGMPWRFVMLDDGLYKFLGSGEFTGGSLAASSVDVIPFSRVKDDDLQWSLNMRRTRSLFIERDAIGYCYNRTSRPVSRVIWGGSIPTRFAFGDAEFYGSVSFSAVNDPSLVSLCRRAKPSDAEIISALE